MIPRPATAADIPALHRLLHGLAGYERLLHHFTVTEDGLRDLLFAPGAAGKALLIGDPPVGMAIYYHTLNTFQGGRGMFLEDLFVEPGHRGKGLGLALLRRLAQIAVGDGCAIIEWRVLNWNRPAIDFYQALGARRMTDWQVRQLGGEAMRTLAKGTPNG